MVKVFGCPLLILASPGYGYGLAEAAVFYLAMDSFKQYFKLSPRAPGTLRETSLADRLGLDQEWSHRVPDSRV